MNTIDLITTILIGGGIIGVFVLVFKKYAIQGMSQNDKLVNVVIDKFEKGLNANSDAVMKVSQAVQDLASTFKTSLFEMIEKSGESQNGMVNEMTKMSLSCKQTATDMNSKMTNMTDHLTARMDKVETNIEKRLDSFEKQLEKTRDIIRSCEVKRK